MTHPPSGPHTPTPPAGPRKPTIRPLDPDTEAGRAAGAAISEALAEIQVAIWRRRRQEQAA